MERSPALADLSDLADVARNAGLNAVTTSRYAGGAQLVGRSGADVSRSREDQRRRRLLKIAMIVGVPTLVLWLRIAFGHPTNLLQVPHVNLLIVLYAGFFVIIAVAMLGPFWFFGRSPHVVFRPEQIDVTLDDVVGIEPVKDEVIRSINLFLSHKQFAGEMGGTPRRGLLFEGSPGTGKTHTAKAMANAAGVPFFFVSATSFQSMFYGATARQIRSYFKALRKAAIAEGGAIGFIEEIDAIGGRRGGMAAMTAAPAVNRSVQCCSGTALDSPLLTAGLTTSFGAGTATNRAVETNQFMSSDTGGTVNELLVQMQSFDTPTGWQKLSDKLIAAVNLLLPAHRQIPKPQPPHANVLVIAATNRADGLDPALVRPGRFDRSLHFDLPDQRGRKLLLEHFLARKAHHDELDEPDHRSALASVTNGYTPVMIEQLCDEGLINAVRRGDSKMDRKDMEGARLTLEVGLGQPVGYTAHERQLIATHEAGHATTAYLVAPGRRLEVLSIIKRRDALGMLAHGDAEEVYTRSRSEMRALIQIAMGGQCAEELFFGDVSTGPAGDLLYATNIAAQMIGAAGMEGTLASYAAVQGSTLNDTNIVGRVLGDADGRRRVEELLQEQKMVVKGLLESNQHLVAALRDALIARDELVGHEIGAVLDAARDLDARPVDDAAPAVIDLRDADLRNPESDRVTT